MQKLLIPVILVVNVMLLSGCANWEFPWVYRINVDQGNIITQKKVNQLKPGMTPDQVRFVMGTPLLTDTFHDNRWDYVYTLRNGDTGDTTEKRVTVYFKDGHLNRITGDFAPQASAVPPAAQQAKNPPSANAPAFTNPSATEPGATN